MLFEKHNPQTDEMIQIMDQNGLIVRSDLMPDLSVNEMIEMYKTMVFVRVIDTKTVQYQRQGRILTYAPNFGQEATQVGSIFGAKETDWVASAFRELGVWLHKGIPLYNVLLYWYGNELGMQMPDSVRVLPVNIPIASQFQHATGLAYASMYKEEDDVVLAYVGDGGTSHGEFHEALNFAAVKNTANVFIIQNNQYAISTNRKNQSKSETLAQKSIAYGMPGRFVDG
ncbi:MAG: pyruvate dehydrogenase (acetyl-transferring) E1 component subunit alpha, partial [Clostridiales bacterium]|nr:pyruvate dehydrogenase (acetyl-transferring) E1 component subunit alpha [Clostridiales bacterium]